MPVCMCLNTTLRDVPIAAPHGVFTSSDAPGWGCLLVIDLASEEMFAIHNAMHVTSHNLTVFVVII